MSTPFDLFTDEAGRLVLIDAEGLRYDQVKPARLFPLTLPDQWISIQDASGQERACIEKPEELTVKQRAALNDALSKRDFVPVIRTIHHVGRAADGHEWQVTTDRGPTLFRTESDESIQYLGGSRLVIIDDMNTRYLIPDITELDRESRKRLERYY